MIYKVMVHFVCDDEDVLGQFTHQAFHVGSRKHRAGRIIRIAYVYHSCPLSDGSYDGIYIVGEASAIEIGEHSHHNVEALEYAYGDYDPQVEVPGVPPSWTADGALFGFSDNSDAVLIFNPATGETVEYECALDSSDIEGMVFMTEMNDPYTWIVALPCD